MRKITRAVPGCALLGLVLAACASQGPVPSANPALGVKKFQAPAYPPGDAKRRVEGDVIVAVDVDAGGRVVQADVVRSAYPSLATFAVAAAKLWTFTSGPAKTVLTFEFRIWDRSDLSVKSVLPMAAPKPQFFAPAGVRVYADTLVVEHPVEAPPGN